MCEKRNSSFLIITLQEGIMMDQYKQNNQNNSQNRKNNNDQNRKNNQDQNRKNNNDQNRKNNDLF